MERYIYFLYISFSSFLLIFLLLSRFDFCWFFEVVAFAFILFLVGQQGTGVMGSTYAYITRFWYLLRDFQAKHGISKVHKV